MKIDFMKKIKLIYRQLLFKALFLLLLFGCSSVDNNIPENLKSIALDISRHPEKICNLKYYFPDLYNPDCYYKKMLDTNEINELINYINLDYNSDESKYYFEKYESDNVYLARIKKDGICNCNVDSINIIRFHLIKKKYRIGFDFVKCDSMYKIFNIHPIYPYSM